MIEVEPVEGTAILAITVTTDNPINAVCIANIISEVLPLRVVDDTLDLKPLAIVDEATIKSVVKVSPNVTNSTIKGGVVGVLIAIIALVLAAVIDTSIHDEEYIVRTYNYPILARVPKINPVTTPKTAAAKPHARPNSSKKGA